MADNTQIDLRKKENFVRSNVILNIYQKIKEKKLISENFVTILKPLMGI